MQPLVVSVGPLAAASANNISTSQTNPGSSTALALQGTLSTGYAATAICTSQPVAGGAMSLNGSIVRSGVAWLATPSAVVITSLSNDTGLTFTVTGWDALGQAVIAEAVKGSNTSVVSTRNAFSRVLSVVASGASAGNVSVGTNASVVTLDKPRRVLITSAGNDSAMTFTIIGTDRSGLAQSEVLAGANTSTAQSLLDYATVTSIRPSAATASTVTVGTSGVASSRWVAFDSFAFAPVSLQVSVSGTVNYTVQQTLDDPNDPAIGPTGVQWVNSPDATLVAATANMQSNYGYAPRFARVVLNSGTGTVRFEAIQLAARPAA